MFHTCVPGENCLDKWRIEQSTFLPFQTTERDFGEIPEVLLVKCGALNNERDNLYL